MIFFGIVKGIIFLVFKMYIKYLIVFFLVFSSLWFQVSANSWSTLSWSWASWSIQQPSQLSIPVPQVQQVSLFQTSLSSSVWLISSWDFDGDANDNSWNWNDGVTYNITSTNPWLGWNNNVFDFNGTSSYVTIPDYSAIDITGDMSVSFWVKFDTLNNNITFLGKYDGIKQPFNYLYNSITWRMWYYSTAWQSVVYSDIQSNLNTWEWYHLSYVRQWSNLSFYVNWVQNWSTTVLSVQQTNNANVTIGQTFNQNWLDGQMWLVRVYDTSLSQEEVDDLYQEWQEKILWIIPPPVPTNLWQFYLNTEIAGAQEIEIWESIWMLQSNSWVLLTANIDSNEPADYLLQVEIYPVWSTVPLLFWESSFNDSGAWEVLFSNFPVGEYYWTAQVKDNVTNEVSEVQQFWENIFINADFAIFEWFEPYPHGYSFINRSTDSSILTWWVEREYWFGLWWWFTLTRERIDWTKWDIFEKAFDLSDLENDPRKLLNAFEILGLNDSNPTAFWWSCFWLSKSALIQKEYPNYLQSYYSNLSTEIWDWYIWGNIGEFNVNSNGDWNDNSLILQDILALQLSQWGEKLQEEERLSQQKTHLEILEELRNNVGSWYILGFEWVKVDGAGYKHYVVPYKVEGTKIYIWDNNIPHYKSVINGKEEKWYNQYIEVLSNNDIWANLYIDNLNWQYISDIYLISLDTIYNWWIKQKPVWLDFRDHFSIFFWGASDILVTDNEWNKAWYYNNEIYREIDWVWVTTIANFNPNIDIIDNTKQIYFPQNRDDLTIQISWTIDEEYDLMIAWKDYYTKLEWVSIKSSQIDTFVSAASNLQIDFDDAKIWDYNILIDNFQDSGTWTLYIDSVDVIPENQSFTIDWDKVVQNTEDAIIYETDSDNDGFLDTTILVPAITTGEELNQDEQQESTYTYPSKTISWNSGQQRAISSWYSIVPNFDEYSWWEDIIFTTSWEWNPTVNTTNSGRQSSWVLRSWANIQIDVPPVWESYTAYLHIWEYTLEFTTSRDSAPAPDVWTLDFWTKTVNYSWTATSNWVSFPFLSEDTIFILTGEWNPTAQTVDGQRSDSWFVRWWTNIKAEIPEPGETRVIEFEILWQIGTFTIIRQ